MNYFEQLKRFGRTLWKKWSGYHRRSLVETKMHCIKLLSDKLSARNFQSQVNEVHARIAILNNFYRIRQTSHPSCHINLRRLAELLP